MEKVEHTKIYSEKLQELGKKSGLPLCLCEGIFKTGKVVVHDSGFFILQFLIGLKKRGVFCFSYGEKKKILAETYQ